MNPDAEMALRSVDWAAANLEVREQLTNVHDLPYSLLASADTVTCLTWNPAVSFAFARYDQDGDGELDQSEARLVMEVVGIARSDAAGRFQEMDSNSNGRISLQEWEAAGNIHPPLALRITTFDGTVETHPMETADFGPDLRQVPGTVHGGIIAIADPIEACAQLTGHYVDRIILAQRGTCEFCIKAKAAQAAGAKAVIIANLDETLLHMTYGTCGADVTIPSIMVPFSVGQELQHARYTAASIVFPTCLSGTAMKPGFGMEQCDDGNLVSGDGCSAQCMSECGNGIVSSDEECDDGNQESFDGCSSSCTIERGIYECTDPAGCHTQCGDGHVVEVGCYLSGLSKTFARTQNIAVLIDPTCLALLYCLVSSAAVFCKLLLALLLMRCHGIGNGTETCRLWCF